MKNVFLLFAILFNLNAVILSSFHDHVHHSKFENCLILNYQNNAPEFKDIKIEIEKPKVIFEIIYIHQDILIISYNFTIPQIRSPPSI